MKHIINSGIYCIDTHGKNKSEFVGNHPTLILKSIKNDDMFYIFPLTTYTEDKWNKCRKKYCCRITSTNSIVRIDKVQILHSSEITSRWIEDDSFIIPEPKEIKVVYEKYKEYIEFSTKVAINDYEKYYRCYNNLLTKLHEHFHGNNLQEDIITDFDNNKISFNMNLVTKVSFDDVKHIIYNIFEKNDVEVKYNKDQSIIEIFVKNNNLMLTIKDQYDRLNLTKGIDNM